MVTFVPSMLRWSVEAMKPGARLTEPSVARVSRSTSRCWLAGSTVKTLISATMLSFSDVCFMGQPPNAGFWPPTAAFLPCADDGLSMPEDNHLLLGHVVHGV